MYIYRYIYIYVFILIVFPYSLLRAGKLALEAQRRKIGVTSLEPNIFSRF